MGVSGPPVLLACVPMQRRGYGYGGGATLSTRRNIARGASPWRRDIRPRGETGAPIFGPWANAGPGAASETAGATRPWRIHAETFVCESDARAVRGAPVARPGRRDGRHVQ